jgi:hypothetical protein
MAFGYGAPTREARMDSYLTDIVFVAVAILVFLLALRQKPKSKSDSGGELRSSYADRSNNLNDRP